MTPQEKIEFSEKLSNKIENRFGDEVPYLIIMGVPNNEFTISSNLQGHNKKDNIGRSKAILKYMTAMAFYLQSVIFSNFINHNPENN